MPKYLTIHHETQLDRIVLETRWTEIARDKRAGWQMTLFNVEEGLRYCEWDAPREAVLEEIFHDLGIKWSEIIEVDVTAPDHWHRVQIASSKRAPNCWEVLKCGRELKGRKVGELGVCPVASNSAHHGTNRGQFAGRYCWKVVGTFCGAHVQNEFAAKMRDCATCKFFQQVKREEGSMFVP